jgi:hypothetical protein
VPVDEWTQLMARLERAGLPAADLAAKHGIA